MGEFVIMQEGRQGTYLFLVDRRQTRSCWWSTELTSAMIFRKQSAADTQCRKLHFNHPQVIPLSAAHEYEMDNIFTGDHPFSSDALGQE